ncbi:MAG: T9SS type A sorting domain-containing protein [Bacteroidales bacterium]|nr:T9SS type A sorting domain-containing protein [Bacteroidales bacterium]
MGQTMTNLDANYYCYGLQRVDTVTNTRLNYKPILWKIFPYDNSFEWTPYRWRWEQTNQWMMLLPIIEVVDTVFANAPECPRVSGLFIRGNYTDTVTLQWSSDSLHTEFELSYGPEGIRAGEGTRVTLNDTRWQYTDTNHRDVPMVAWVRTVCREYDTLRWSDWSAPVYFLLHHEGDSSGHEGIVVPDDESDLSRFVMLMPNPASSGVGVLSSYGIDRLEVYDMRGVRVLEQKGQGRETSAGFDVSNWAMGTYVVLVHTPAGTAAKRLLVK